MKRFFWIDGRLSWPLVIALVFATVSLIAVDLVWRIVIVPFDTFLIYAFIIDGIAALILIGTYFRFRRR